MDDRTSYRVLVADDDRIHRLTLLYLLRTHGARIEESSSAEDAAALLATAAGSGDPFSALVTDCHMGCMDGITLLERCREASPSTLRVMVTADAAMRDAASQRGAVHLFLTKPVDAGAIRQLLQVDRERRSAGARA